MPAAHPVSRRLRALAAATTLALLVGACGDDDDTEAGAGDETTTTAAPTEAEPVGGEVAEYCSAAAELDEQEGPPTAEQMTHLKEVRPDEIGEEVDFVADAIIGADGDFGKVFGDPEVERRLGVIEEYESENCGGEDAGEDGEEEAATEPLVGADVVPVSAVDFAFEGIPAELTAGPTSFEFTNDGESSHEMFIVRLGEGVVLDELLASDEEPTDEQAQDIGGTFSEPGGETTYVNAERLEPGTYAVLCFVPGPGGKPHHELGMKTTFQVS